MKVLRLVVLVLMMFAVCHAEETVDEAMPAEPNDEGVMPDNKPHDETAPVAESDADTAPGDETKECTDELGLNECKKWQTYGFCKTRSEYMGAMCKKTCGVCSDGTPVEPEPCKDYNENCAKWAEAGRCEASPDYMIYRCRKSCNTCE